MSRSCAHAVLAAVGLASLLALAAAYYLQLAEGSCADRSAAILGVPLALVSAMVFVLLGVAAAFAATRR